MVELSNAKIFGGIGALLMLIGGFIPYGGPVVSILGLVFIFIAVKTISDLTKDKDIFSNYLMHFIFGILTIVAIVVIMLIAFGAAGGFIGIHVEHLNQLQALAWMPLVFLPAKQRVNKSSLPHSLVLISVGMIPGKLRKVEQQHYYVYDRLKGDYSIAGNMKNFEQAKLENEAFYPVLLRNREDSDLICLKSKKT